MAPPSTGALSTGPGTAGGPVADPRAAAGTTTGSPVSEEDTGSPAAPHEAARRPGAAPGSVTRPLTASNSALADAGDLLRALAAPVRIAIVLQLREADRCVHELVDALDFAQPLISQHLRVLKTAGVVQGERRGREVVYRLVDDHLAHIVVDAVAHVQEGK
ncbi:ArsR/SmtB family transcription factor [Amycolatopsis sp. FDAARGOS 1241]|uniref:ArsR/SmtB family transcription factor n=1 Tax=Amycolatopsis sp. FDAARGOS 1241 TaxID=2778070 RepID=UPI00351C1278